MYLPSNTARTALSIGEFHDLLRPWSRIDDDKKATIGDTAKRKQTAWIFVTDGDQIFHLNADSTREGVAGYLAMVDQADGALEWSMRDATKVVFGRYALHQPGFFLYRR